MKKELFRNFDKSFFLFILMLFSFFLKNDAKVIPLNEPQTTYIMGTRNLIFVPEWNRTWIFYTNNKGFCTKSFDGQNWTDETVVISTTDAGGNVNLVYGSVYYRSVSSEVFVIANTGAVDLTASPWNAVYVRKGNLNSNGSISWSSIQPFVLTGAIGAGTSGDCMAGGSVGIVRTYNDNAPIFIVCDAKRSGTSVQTSVLYRYNIDSSLSGGTNGTVDANNSVNENILAPQYVSVVPINDGGTARVLIAMRDRSDYNGALRVVRYDAAGGGYNNENAGENSGSTSISDSFTHSIAEVPNSSIVHVVYIDSNGYLVYTRRTGAGSWITAITVDNSGASASAPYGQPTITYSPKNTSDPSSFDKIYIVYVSTFGTLNYAVAPATATAAANFTIYRNVWLPNSGTISAPKTPSLIPQPYPIPLMWSDGDGVYFDRIPTSNNPNPTFTSATPSTVGIGAGVEDTLMDSTYDIVINGNNFLNNPPPSVYFERNGFDIDGISVTSVTYVSANQIQVHFKVDQSVSAGPVDLRISNFDAREVFVVGAVTITVPTSELTYPVGIKYSTGISNISGTADFYPKVGQNLINSQVKIIRNDNGYQWSGSSWVDPTSNGQQWLTATGSSPWSYSFPNDEISQPNGIELRIVSRGRTSDRGFGKDSIPS
ncbi:MAG: hypothetical protein QW076_06305, partial [Candidatus Anstonellales archaeon]